MYEFKNLHEVIHQAQDESEPPKAPKLSDDAVLVRMEEAMKRDLFTVCRSNGITVSSFLRGCAKQLISEYRGA